MNGPLGRGSGRRQSATNDVLLDVGFGEQQFSQALAVKWIEIFQPLNPQFAQKGVKCFPTTTMK